MTDQPTGGTPTSRAMSDGTPPPPPPAEGPGDERRSRRPSKAILALGLAIVIVAGAAIIGVTSSGGDDASQDEQGDPTTSAHAADRSTATDVPATTTTTADPAVLASERQAGAEAACTEAVNAPLGAEAVGLDAFADAVWDPGWSDVASREDFDRQVAECAGPQRADRYEAECGAPNVGLIQRDPDSHSGQCVTMHALVSQFDQATGLCAFRAWWDDSQHTYNFDYEGENAIAP